MRNPANPKQLVLGLFRKQGGEELLEHQAEIEQELITQANRVLDLAQLSPHIQPPSVEERAEELEDGFVALVDDDFRDFYIRRYADVKITADWEDVSGYVGMEESAWEQQKQTIRETFESKGWESEDPVDEYIRGLFGVHVWNFEANIIDRAAPYSDGDLLERFLRGDDYVADDPVFVGLGTAEDAMRLAMDTIEDGIESIDPDE